MEWMSNVTGIHAAAQLLLLLQMLGIPLSTLNVSEQLRYQLCHLNSGTDNRTCTLPTSANMCRLLLLAKNALMAYSKLSSLYLSTLSSYCYVFIEPFRALICALSL